MIDIHDQKRKEFGRQVVAKWRGFYSRIHPWVREKTLYWSWNNALAGWVIGYTFLTTCSWWDKANTVEKGWFGSIQRMVFILIGQAIIVTCMQKLPQNASECKHLIQRVCRDIIQLRKTYAIEESKLNHFNLPLVLRNYVVKCNFFFNNYKNVTAPAFTSCL